MDKPPKHVACKKVEISKITREVYQDTLHGLWCTPPPMKGSCGRTVGGFVGAAWKGAHHETLHESCCAPRAIKGSHGVHSSQATFSFILHGTLHDPWCSPKAMVGCLGRVHQSVVWSLS